MRTREEFRLHVTFDTEADGCQEFLRERLAHSLLGVEVEIKSGRGRDTLVLTADHADTLAHAEQFIRAWSTDLVCVHEMGAVITWDGKVWHPASDEPVGVLLGLVCERDNGDVYLQTNLEGILSAIALRLGAWELRAVGVGD